MATNKYFNYGDRNQQNLYESLVIESIQMYGQDVYYLPREIVNKDALLLDDVPSRFGSAYKVEMYIENQDGFEGEGDLFTKFGIELRDQANFVVARKRWKNLIGNNLDKQNFRPREGDLIYLPMSESIFEILKVETETPFYQLKNLPTFRLQCELFEYSDEDLDTDIASIDILEKEGAFQYRLTMDSSGGGFQVGEDVQQNLGTYIMSGEVTNIIDSGGTYAIDLAHVGASDGNYHEFITGTFAQGQTSSAVSKPTLVAELQEIQKDSQNVVFDNFESDFLDFSESNPFGYIS